MRNTLFSFAIWMSDRSSAVFVVIGFSVAEDQAGTKRTVDSIPHRTAFFAFRASRAFS
jgi:hypothetical protein